MPFCHAKSLHTQKLDVFRDQVCQFTCVATVCPFVNKEIRVHRSFSTFMSFETLNTELHKTIHMPLLTFLFPTHPTLETSKKKRFLASKVMRLSTQDA